MKPGRNAPCPCGSGKKYKKCCMAKDGHAVVESTEFIRRRLRKTEGELGELLLEYASGRFGNEAFEEAREEFRLGKEIDIDENVLIDMDSMFSLWFIFTWDAWDRLEEMDNQHPALDNLVLPVALLYLSENQRHLDDFQRRYIKEVCSRPYSFYQVIEVEPGESLTIRDLFMNQTHLVMETQARLDVKGGILFTRVITVDGVSVMLGCFSLLIPGNYHGAMIDMRQEMEKNGPLTADELLDYDFEMREIFFEIYDKLRKKPLPELRNTDDELLVPVKLIYDLDCTPAEAFERLKSLAVGMDEEELGEETERDQTGTLQKIHFRWLKIGNKKNPGWENTVLGHIEIDEGQLTIGVNSKNRSDKIQKEIKKRLGKKAVYKKSVMISPQKMMEEARETGPGAAWDQDWKRSQDELMELPEVKAKLAEMSEKHWDAWINIPLPALGGKTPRQAAKDPIGREKLKGVFLHFETMMRKVGQNEFSPDIAGLKKRLGLED